MRKTESPKRRREAPKPGARAAGRSFPKRLVFSFAIACVLNYGFEQWLDHAIESSGQPRNALTEGLFGAAIFYHRLVTASPRKPLPRFTTLVTLSEKDSPPGVSLLNICTERRFLGDLLRSLSNVHPAVVLIDKYFGAATCPSGDSGTLNLIGGVQALCDSHVSVVVARNIKPGSGRGEERSSLYLLEPGLSFGPGAACVTEGVATLDIDLRRVSLWWPNIESLAGSNIPPPSLALAAAIAARPGLLKSGRLAGWQPDWPPPYVSFLERGQFASNDIPASKLVCPSPDPPGWRACADAEINPSIRRITRGSVVVIGEDFPDVDRHDTVVGDTPGYVLQANYVESLLDDRLIRPVTDLTNTAAGFVIFFLFNYLVWRYHQTRRAAAKLILFGWVILLCLGSSVIIYLSVVILGYYLNPATISLLAAIVLLAHMLLTPGEPAGEGQE